MGFQMAVGLCKMGLLSGPREATITQCGTQSVKLILGCETKRKHTLGSVADSTNATNQLHGIGKATKP